MRHLREAHSLHTIRQEFHKQCLTTVLFVSVVCMRKYVFVCVCVCGGQRSTVCVLLSHSPPYFFRSLSEPGVSLVRLLGPKAPGSLLCLPPQSWDYKHTPSRLFLVWVLDPNSDPHARDTHTLLTEPSLWLITAVCRGKSCEGLTNGLLGGAEQGS